MYQTVGEREIPKEGESCTILCIWKLWRKGCTYECVEGGAWANLTLFLRLIWRLRLSGAGGVLLLPYGESER